jgi:hypothetical protein
MHHLYKKNKNWKEIPHTEIKTTVEYKDFTDPKLFWKMDEDTALYACMRIFQRFDLDIRGRHKNFIASGRDAQARGKDKDREKKARLWVSNVTYKDSAASSHKKIYFWVRVPKDSTRNDYVLVNWIKGHMKKGDGTYWKAKMYGSLVNANFGGWQVDSVDADPVYWSDASGRWNYVNAGDDAFYGTDDPGPALSTETGAKYKLDFKIELYKRSDVPVTTTGNLGGAESKGLSSINWTYHVDVDASGKFTH